MSESVKYQLPEHYNMLDLPKNLPFKLATTSFIYPDRIIPNVMKLGSVFDEIELLLFESRPFIPDWHNINGKKPASSGPGGRRFKIKPVEVLPSPEEIRQLVDLSKRFDLTYNVHLPVDISITDISEAARISAIDTIKRVVELCAPLNPTTCTLHLEFKCGVDGESSFDGNFNKHLHKWRDRIAKSLENLSSSLSDPSIISIETLDYPFEYIEDIVESCGMSVCIDAGHLIRYGYSTNPCRGSCDSSNNRSNNNNSNNNSIDGYSIQDIFEKHKKRVPLIHLHGVDFSSGIPQDHKSLDKTPPRILAPTMNVLRDFTGVVSIEVFNYGHLYDSLRFLNNFLMNRDDYFRLKPCR